MKTKQTKVSNLFTDSLPGDPETGNKTRQVFESCYSFVEPKKPGAPTWAHFNEELGNQLGLNKVELLNQLSGAENFEGFKPYAMCYGGHQFGHWAGQLGDGRAINVAEVDGVSGQCTEVSEGTSNYTIQLKGAGKTPYSRNADGLAVLRSSLREYLCSEAMFHLGVPTTRALSLVLTGDQVMRDILYNGNPALEKGAICSRVAPSFLRIGNFELFTVRRDFENLRVLADFAIKNYFPHLGEPSKKVYLEFFNEVVKSTFDLMLEWERVGFVHGVMNTDNMSILGLTIDYGPYGWLEDYDKDWTPNTTDAQGRRYRFGNQGMIGLWNLVQFANALYPLIEDAEALEESLSSYQSDFERERLVQIGRKIALKEYSEEVGALAFELENMMSEFEIDMTLFYRNLSRFESFEQFEQILRDCSYLESLDLSKWKAWLSIYEGLLKKEGRSQEERKKDMNAINPKYVLRNYMAQLAIDDADEGDFGLLDELFQLLRNPYDEQPEKEKWFAKRPDWAKNRVGCSMLSCSS